MAVLKNGFLFCCIFVTIILWTDGKKTQCNTFPYEKALFEKTIRMEFEVRKMRKGFDMIKAKVANEVNKLRDFTEKMITQVNETTRLELYKLKEAQTDVNETIKRELQKFKETRAEVKKTTEHLSRDLQNKNNQLNSDIKNLITNATATIDELANDLETLQEQSEEKLITMSEDLMRLKNETRTVKQRIGFVKPNVAFLARSVSNRSPGINTKLRFTTTLINTDNCYSTNTGEFISPVNGTYWFSTQICGLSNQYVNFRIYVNDVIISDTTQYDDTSYGCTTANTVAILRTGDNVHVETGPKTNSGVSVINQGSYKWSMFMGALIN